MKFLIDAQLPRRMAKWLNDMGYDSLHTLDLPNANRSTDDQILEAAARDDRIVVTKDADFVAGHVLLGKPPKLLLSSTGNIANRELEQLFIPLIPTLAAEFQNHSFVELGRAGVVIRE
jgi:predicted nuclease of predicted toxin-antitoxin system